jgi:genome maintenance exonuclease 1
MTRKTKRAVADARAKLATAFKAKAKSVNEKYIVPPKTTDFAIVYAPTESLYKELTEYQDPSTKELLTQELMKKHKVVICGPNTLSAYLQSLHMGFQSLKVQKGATEIYNHLKTITSRFGKHFDNIISLRKKLEEAMSVVDKFGTDARSITRTLESIKDPEQLEKAVQTENVEKFVDRQNKQIINFFFSKIANIRNHMEWNNKYNYPKSTRSIVDGSRHYSVNEERLPSVTTILKATESEEKKASLQAWKQRVGQKQAEIITREASSRGSSMHEYLEKFLLGKLNLDLLGDNTRERMMADQIIENGLRNKLDEIWGCEATLYYPGKYAGAADCVGVYENKETIIDFKQSNKPKKDEWIDDYYLQCAAYALAHNTVHGSNITQAVILLCTKDNMFQRFLIEGDRLKDYQNKFLEKVEQFYAQRRAN